MSFRQHFTIFLFPKKTKCDFITSKTLIMDVLTVLRAKMSEKVSVLYTGAGLDVGVINIFPEKDIVFVDAQPFSEYDMPYRVEFYRSNFVNNLISAYSAIEYEKIGEKILTTEDDFKVVGEVSEIGDELKKKPDYFEPTLFLFKHTKTGRESKYYVSSAFPTRMSNDLERDMRECNGLILSGFFPLVGIYTYLRKPFELICSDSSVYLMQNADELDDEGENIVHTLISNDSFFKTVVSSVYCFSCEDKMIVKCDNLSEVQEICDAAAYKFARKMAGSDL